MNLNIYKGIAIAAYLCLVCGLILRKKKSAHVPLMLTGITLDIIIILILELGRNVIATALDYSYWSLSGGHIIASTIAVLFYIPAVTLGVKLLRGHGAQNPALRTWHMRTALTAFTFRSIGFILMFSLTGQT